MVMKGRKRALSSRDHSTKKAKAIDNNDEIPSEESDLSEEDERSVDSYEEEEELETPHEKRVRLTKLALAKAKQTIGSDGDDSTTMLTVRLQEEALQARGMLFFKVADKFKQVALNEIVCLLGHRKTVTALCVSSDCNYIFSVGKDASLIKWNLKDFSKIKTVKGGGKRSTSPYHTGPIFSIAISDDNKYLATGSADHSIIVWNPETLEVLFHLQRHRSPVTALSFRRQSHMLFSGDKHGRVCVWSLPLTEILQDQGAATQMKVLSMSGLSSERCVSSSGFGGAGICLWKVEQAVCVQYTTKNPAECSIECVYAVNDELYVGGSAANTLYLWHMSRGSPICRISPAHPPTTCDTDSVTARSALNWVTAVTGLFSTDLLASGSSSGHVQLWRLHLDSEKTFTFGGAKSNIGGEDEDGSDEESKPKQARLKVHHDSAKLERIPEGEFQLGGFVNSLAFSNDGKYLVAGIGQEHRLGRWEERRRVRDAVILIPINIPFKQSSDVWM